LKFATLRSEHVTAKNYSFVGGVGLRLVLR
jgi:hypothetical protein